MPQHNIRQANHSDLESVAELFDAYRVFYKKTSDIAGARAFITSRLNNADATLFVVENKSGIIGFTQLYPIFSSTRMQRMWLLNDLFVHPDHRGHGYSKHLLNAAKHFAKTTEASGLLLETDKDNVIGNKLYPQEGFKSVETNFYFWENVSD